MNVILIDTSTRVARVALLKDQEMVEMREWESDPGLGKTFLEAIDQLLQKHGLPLEQIERVAVHRGKEGSRFMALRTGIVTGTTLAEAIDAVLIQIEGQALEDMIREAVANEPVQVIEPFYRGVPNSLDNS